MSTAYHLQTDRQTRVTNKTLEMYLWFFIRENPKI